MSFESNVHWPVIGMNAKFFAPNALIFASNAQVFWVRAEKMGKKS